MTEKTDLTDFLTYGVDLKKRRIYFGLPLDSSQTDSSDFNLSSVEIAVRALHRLAEDAPTRPIEIHMSSLGGDAMAMLRLHDEILTCPCQVKFFGGGAIMSSATWIMAVCDERYLHKNAIVLLHDGSEMMPEETKHTDFLVNAKHTKEFQIKLYEIYAKNSRMPIEFWQDVCQRDLYITAEEAVLLSLADKLIDPQKRGNLRKTRQKLLTKKPKSADMRKLINEIYGRINRVKVPKIELNKYEEEPVDPTVVISDKPVSDEMSTSK